MILEILLQTFSLTKQLPKAITCKETQFECQTVVLEKNSVTLVFVRGINKISSSVLNQKMNAPK